MRSKKWKSVVIYLCLLLIIAYISVIFVPYTHDCVGSDCTVCALIKTSRNTITGLILAAAVHQLTNVIFLILSTHKFIRLGNSCTPVSLKVKLSD